MEWWSLCSSTHDGVQQAHSRTAHSSKLRKPVSCQNGQERSSYAQHVPQQVDVLVTCLDNLAVHGQSRPQDELGPVPCSNTRCLSWVPLSYDGCCSPDALGAQTIFQLYRRGMGRDCHAGRVHVRLHSSQVLYIQSPALLGQKRRPNEIHPPGVFPHSNVPQAFVQRSGRLVLHPGHQRNPGFT